MLTKISFDIPCKGNDSHWFYKLVSDKFGDEFYLGAVCGFLDRGESKSKSTGQVFSFSDTFVPPNKLAEFKDLVLSSGGNIISEESGNDSVISSILTYASQFPRGISDSRIISAILRTDRLNLDASGQTHVELVIKNLVESCRLVRQIAPDQKVLIVNQNEPVWQENEIIRLHNQLLDNIRSNEADIHDLLQEVESHWNEEDMLYRFYHHSFKVYHIQDLTVMIVAMLRKLDPHPAPGSLNKSFELIIEEGTGKIFEMEHNRDWLRHTRPMMEAFYHSKSLLRNALQYGKKLDEAPHMLPSGWGHVLYLYNLR